MRFPATSGWVSLPVVVGVPRHSWLRAPGAVPRHSWLGSASGGGVWSLATPGCGSSLPLTATPGWGLLVAVGCFVRVGVSRVLCVCGVSGCAWWSCRGVFCLFMVAVLLVVWCVVWCGCVFRMRWCAWFRVRGVSVVCGCLSPPLFVGACGWCLCGCGWRVLWVPRHSWLRVLGAVPRHSWLGSTVVSWWLVPRHSWPRAAGAVPRHSWLGSAGCGGGRPLATPGCGPRDAFLLGPGVCVCVCCVARRVGVGAVRGSCAVWLLCVCVCVCVPCVVCGVRHTWLGSRCRSTWSGQKAEKEVL